jgi:hypothetical protein
MKRKNLGKQFEEEKFWGEEGVGGRLLGWRIERGLDMCGEGARKAVI